MQVISAIGAASGKAGGIVASRGRTGAQVCARVQRTQPRSSTQQNARAQTGQIAGLWRNLTHAQRQGWNALASSITRQDRLGQSYTPSGYALFLSNNRTLATFGTIGQLITAPTLSTFPAIDSFSAQPVYDNPTAPQNLIGFALNYAPVPPPQMAAIIRATAPLSAPKANVRCSDLRVIAALDPLPPNSVVLFSSWLELFGTPTPVGTVVFELNLVDPLTGFTAPAVRAACSSNRNGASPYTPNTITVEINSDTVATLENQYIELNGTIVASP